MRYLQEHVGRVFIAGVVGGIAPRPERADLSNSLKEVEHERFPARDGDDQELPLHAVDAHILLRGPIERSPQHILGAVEQILPQCRPVQRRDHARPVLGRRGGQVTLVQQQAARAQRPCALEPAQNLGLVGLDTLHAVDDHGLRLGGVLAERDQLLEARLALDVLVLHVEDEQAVFRGVDTDGAEQVVVEVRDVDFLQVVGHHQVAVLLHPHFRQPRKPLDRHHCTACFGCCISRSKHTIYQSQHFLKHNQNTHLVILSISPDTRHSITWVLQEYCVGITVGCAFESVAGMIVLIDRQRGGDRERIQ